MSVSTASGASSATAAINAPGSSTNRISVISATSARSAAVPSRIRCLSSANTTRSAAWARAMDPTVSVTVVAQHKRAGFGGVLDAIFGIRSGMYGGTGPIQGILQLALLVPTLAVGARRLHDTGRSGWWLLIGLIPIVGWIILIVFLVQSGTVQLYKECMAAGIKPFPGSAGAVS